MESEQIRAVNMEYSEQALEEKTIMFIENYYCGARGLISRIFDEFITNPLYDGYKLVWMAQDYDETVRRFGSWLDSDRVWLCVKNGYDYIKFLNLAKYIYTADYLPAYYMKREGQVVYYAPLDVLLTRKHYTKAMLWHFGATVNHADHILVEKNTPGAASFTDRFGSEKPVLLSDDDGVIQEYMTDRQKMVFISLADTKRGACNLNTFQFIYGFLTLLADAYGYAVHWKIPLSLYKRLRADEVLYRNCPNVHSAETECLSLIKNADVTVSDNMCDIISAGKYCEKLVFYSKAADETEEYDLSRDLYVTDDLESLAQLLEILLSESGEKTETPADAEWSTLFDCPKELKGERKYRLINADDTVSGVWNGSQEETKKKEQPELLIMAETCGFPDMLGKLHDMLLKYKDKARLTVLYRGTWKGALYDQLSDISTDISYICRSGSMQYSDADINKLMKERLGEGAKAGKNAKKTVQDKNEEAERLGGLIAKEWLRILGRDDFDHAIGITGANVFWLNMYDHIPAGSSETYEKEDTADLTVATVEKLIKAFIRKSKTSKSKAAVKEKDKDTGTGKSKSTGKTTDTDTGKSKSAVKTAATGKSKSTGKTAGKTTKKSKSEKADDK